MLKRDEDFVDEIYNPVERKMNFMRVRVKNPSLEKKLDEVMNFIKEKMMGALSNEYFY